MTGILKNIISLRSNLQDFWIHTFWKRPDSLWALKVSIAIAFLVIPFEILRMPFFALTLALGVVGAALAETDDHPKGRLKTLVITLLCFFISSVSVELLRPYPWLFATGMVGATFIFILLGGVSARYQGITFGALLISIYTMLGTGIKPWYYQPLLLPLGGLCYGIISLLLLYMKPFRLLKEQLSTGYNSLAAYMQLKSNLFPSNSQNQDKMRNRLAQKNIEVAQRIENCKNVLYSYANEIGEKSLDKLSPYYNQWLLLQQMHERAASSHERYDVLSKQTNNIELIEGFGQLLSELSDATQKYAESLLTGKPFKYPIALKWTASALKNMMAQHANDSQYPALSLLLQNLLELNKLLKNITKKIAIDSIENLNYKPRPIQEQLRNLLNIRHPRFRYAVRLCMCFLLGYFLINYFDIYKGDWILLTSLFVCQQSYTATRQRLFQRITGTVFGVILGVVAANLLPTSSGQVLLFIVTIYAFFYWLRKRYAVAVVFITMFVVAAFNILSGLGIAVMTPRLIDTLIGAFLAFLVVRFLWPDWQYKQLPQLLLAAVSKNKRYFETIYESSEPDAVYHHNRRAAHQADNALTMAWKGMHLEPKSKRFFQKKAFILTYQNHALLSYISALGAHHHRKPLKNKDLKLCKRISEILETTQNFFIQKSKESEKQNFIKESIAWENELWQIKKRSKKRKIILIHNIARISVELLQEAYALKKYEDEK